MFDQIAQLNPNSQSQPAVKQPTQASQSNPGQFFTVSDLERQPRAPGVPLYSRTAQDAASASARGQALINLLQTPKPPNDSHTVERALNFIQDRINLNLTDTNGNTPLHLAILHGHTDIAAALLNAGASLNTINSGGNTPLIWAILHRHEAIALTLIECGAAINQADKLGKTPLDWAVSSDQVAVIERLKAKGALYGHPQSKL